MKSICIVFPGELSLGGVESSLIGLLETLDYSRCKVDLFVYGHHGSLFPYIDPRAHLLPEVKELAYIRESLKDKLKHGCWYAAMIRILSVFSKKDINYLWSKVVRRCAKKLPQSYDVALGFCAPFDFIFEKVDAKVKVGWIHTDYTGFAIDAEELKREYSQVDRIAAVSDACKKSFCEIFPCFKEKVMVIENILPKKLIERQANIPLPAGEMSEEGCVKLLSIGRFCHQKNFDNVPLICKALLRLGCNVKWYLIGYGPDRELIRQKIEEVGMQDFVIILGKKENPYPYILHSDIYVQPSRYEGKSVAVREAQMLHKPVIITDYATASSQLEDGVDGIIVPMDNEGCARGIADVIRNRELQDRLIENTRNRDYTNAEEVGDIYSFSH